LRSTSHEIRFFPSLSHHFRRPNSRSFLPPLPHYFTQQPSSQFASFFHHLQSILFRTKTTAAQISSQLDKMKSTILAVSAFVAAVAAQNVSGLPQCGQTCVNNMLADDKADELGCDSGDVACLCVNPNFTYGVRDCSLAICDQDEVSEIVNRAIAICAEQGVLVTTAEGSASATSVGTESAAAATETSSESSSATVSTVLSTITSAVDTTTIGDGAGGVGGIVTTISSDGSAIVSTITSGAGGILTTISSDGSAIVSTITSGAGGLVTTISSDGSAIVSTITSGAAGFLSTVTSDGSTFVTSVAGAASSKASDAASKVSSIADEASSAISSAAGEATGTGDNDGAAGPQKTAAPLGILAAAGVAIMLL
jgi:hypothetical protein